MTDVTIFVCEEKDVDHARGFLVGVGFPPAGITATKAGFLLYDPEKYLGRDRKDSHVDKWVVIGRLPD